ncbi:hypothetical protein GSY74_01615 [Sulfurovum sp. bin170]|uniref:hypothetical protein n=1 Tax=Sulfurovum sp. bin170 TaxID=2695268 RepID=UPI0013DF5EBE|nr:hypothetical protein [Sulfurovum sp. bin170]NEW59968.1 hypothetical protein [Sulfurovum sp. bin170]
MRETEETVVTSKPLSTIDKKLKEKFAEDIANQSSLMDEIGKLLITVELGTPALYATVLKLISGDGAMLESGFTLGLTFFLWFGALVLTFLAIFPKPHRVDSSRLDEIEAFYNESAKHKARMLMWSMVLFFVGIGCSVWTITV